MERTHEDTFFILQSNKIGGSVIYEDMQTVEVDYFENKVNAVPVFDESVCVNLSFSATGICSASANKDKAFELLALTQTDGYLNNLMTFGIEGEDYLLDGDTVIETNNYFNSSRFGNYMLCHLWERNDITAGNIELFLNRRWFLPTLILFLTAHLFMMNLLLPQI